MSVTDSTSSGSSPSSAASSPNLGAERSLAEPATRLGRERAEPAAKALRRGPDFSRVLEQAERRHEGPALPRRVGGIDPSRDRRFARREHESEGPSFAATAGEPASARAHLAEITPTERTATPALEQIAGEVVRGVEVSRARGGSEVRLELNTPDLGLASVKVGQDAKGRIAVEFAAVNETGRRLIEDGAGSLLSALESRGLNVKSITVAAPGEGALDALRASGGRLDEGAAEGPQSAARPGAESGRHGQAGDERSRGFFRYHERGRE